MSAPIPILLNSRAGALHQTAGEDQLRQISEEMGLPAEIMPTEGAEQMARMLRGLVARKAERLAVAGGDGTVSVAVQELAHTDTVRRRCASS